MTTESQSRNTKMAWKLGFFAVVMFGFAVWFMPILYGLICDLTGLGSPTAKEAAEQPTANPDNPFLVNESADSPQEGSTAARNQPIRVLFTTRKVGNMPWEFWPEEKSVVVNPGERKTVYFHAKNLDGQNMVGQTIPSFTPAYVGLHFKKFECFCFSHQALESGESDRMAMTFYIDPSIGTDVKEITLNYQLFDITDRVASNPSEQGGDS